MSMAEIEHIIVSHCEKIQRNIAQNRLQNTIQLHQIGLWDTHAELKIFKSGEGASVIQTRDDHQTEASLGYTRLMPLDEWVKRQRIDKLDVIKMDIEGAEQRALEGAKDTIRRFSPTLILSLYHRLDDLYEIPGRILQIDDRYRFYITHPIPSPSETLLFATIAKCEA